ncbi:CHAD domain-containing protein [Microbaculum marinum]|uniref:CHAD domain-containing protein n=1 Tax=Microbaculum marinum TaxID=1764581 RepID=A0AAW9RT35_9HYPH
MAYRFKLSDASVEAGVRRIALDQIDKAIAEIDDAEADQHETVHQFRKRCKKLRGLIRLVRPAFPAYADENAAFRDAARTLSPVRDSEALIETYDALMDRFDDQVERRAFASIRRRMTWRQRDTVRKRDISEKIEAARDMLVAARSRAGDWRIKDGDFGDTIGAGLAKTYRRARKAMRSAVRSGDPAEFHEWRKRVKYHRYHTRLLTPMWDGPLEAHRQAAETLSDILGDHHDLAVLQDVLSHDPEAYGNPADVEAMIGLAQRRQETLAAEAGPLGAKLLAEPPDKLARRWQAYWTAWTRQRREQRSLAA